MIYTSAAQQNDNAYRNDSAKIINEDYDKCVPGVVFESAAAAAAGTG